jgi:RimJ/RimL family protein N-acetyltransferase
MEILMYTKILLVVACLITNITHAAEKDGKIREIPLPGGYALVPYQAKHIDGLKSVVNDPEVFPHIRHGGKWNDDLIQKRHNAYLEGNANNNTKYDPTTFLACWVLISPSGEIIGRGGFQPEDECQPVATEAFFAIKGNYQGKGLMQASWRGMHEWFDNVVGSDKLLRWLTMKDNIASIHLAQKFGFKPRANESGDAQLVIKNWDKEYFVFERNGTHDLSAKN